MRNEDIEGIAPIWWQSLEKTHVIERFLDIRMCRSWVGFKTPYGCVKCAFIADEYEQAIIQHREEGHLAYDLVHVNEIPSRFEKHWSEEHECGWE